MADMIDKVLQDLFAARCMRDLGMKLQAIQLSISIFDRGKIGIFGARDSPEPGRQSGQFVAVTAPDVDLFGQSIEQGRPLRRMQNTRPIFAPRAKFDLTAQVVRHQLHSVTNAEDWNTERKNLRIA